MVPDKDINLRQNHLKTFKRMPVYDPTSPFPEGTGRLKFAHPTPSLLEFLQGHKSNHLQSSLTQQILNKSHESQICIKEALKHS